MHSERRKLYAAMAIAMTVVLCLGLEQDSQAKKAKKVRRLKGQGRTVDGFFSRILTEKESKLSGVDQVLIATGKEGKSHHAELHVFERTKGSWSRAFKPIDAVIGKNGFAPIDEKKEGDKRTPTGLYSLGLVFGYAASVTTGMEYRQATKNDVWVDDPASDLYNTWSNVRPSAGSYEELKRPDCLYKYGIVIEYNTRKIVKDKGSAIFLHVWRSSDSYTSGCIAVSEKDIKKIITWLDKEKKPRIFIGIKSDLPAL